MAPFTADQFQFSDGTPVCSKAQKFIIPVPDFGTDGEPLVFPGEYVVEGKDLSGTPITNYKGVPIGDYGIVFGNAVDQTIQAAVGDGSAIIIINEVTKAQSELLFAKVSEYADDPMELTLQELKAVLKYAYDELGLKDQYNSTRKFASENFSPVDATETDVKTCYGHKKRDSRDIFFAVYMEGDFEFEGPSASPQKFFGGGVLLKHGDSVRGIQTEEFARTYTFVGGARISDVAKQIKNA